MTIEQEHMHDSINQSSIEFVVGITTFSMLELKNQIYTKYSVLSNSHELANQIDGAMVGNSFPYASSTLQNLPKKEYEDFVRKLEEDIDTDNFGNFRKAR